ncbi:hypothetical protein KY321_01145, partial [Candidatus Woesearchaeota archaeon]|nr:hypothetical protein [Candidatus Woesearchaeota archaeon]
MNIPVVMTSMSRHDHLSSASLSLAKELSLGRKVFYINNPYTYKDNVVSWKGARIFSFSVDYPNLFVVETEKVLPINFLPDNFLYDVVSGINNKIFNKSFKDIVKHHNIRKKEYILFNSFNPFYGIKIPGILEPLLTIYQSRDDIASAPYVKKHGVRLELEWIKKSE